MYAFNRRFDNSKLLFLPPMCFVGMILILMGLVMLFMVSFLSMKALGLIMSSGGVFLTIYSWRYRNNAHLVKTFSENVKDNDAIPFGLVKGHEE